MKLTKKSKPKKLTLSQVWNLYRMDTGTETPEFIVKMLDLCYPNKDRESIDIMDKFDKYYQAKNIYSRFLMVIKGMVGNG